MPTASSRLLALTALAGMVVLAGCPTTVTVDVASSPSATKKPSAKPTKKPSGSPSSGSPKPTGSKSPSPSADPAKSPSPSPTASASGSPSPSPTPTGTPTPTPTPSATATPAAADQAAIDAATAFPFTVVGQVWTYDTAAKLGIIDLTGTRVLTVKALTATEATIHVKDVTIKPAMAGGGEQVTEEDVVVPKTAADPYFTIISTLNKFDAVTPGTPAYTTKTDTVLGTAGTNVILKTYTVPPPADVTIISTRVAGKGEVASSLTGKKLPASIPIPIPVSSFTLTTKLKSFTTP